jgi:alpha-galactosidase
MADGSRAVILFNRGTAEQNIAFNWEEIGYPANIAASVRDLWQHKDLGKQTGKMAATVPAHGVAMLAMRPE